MGFACSYKYCSGTYNSLSQIMVQYDQTYQSIKIENYIHVIQNKKKQTKEAYKHRKNIGE